MAAAHSFPDFDLVYYKIKARNQSFLPAYQDN